MLVQKIRCPNCGSEGERHHIPQSRLIRTQCSCCDYLMVTCAETGKVVEAYAPGVDAERLSLRCPQLPTSSISLQTTRVTHTNSNLMLMQDVNKSLNSAKSGTLVVRFPNGVIGD
jgi:uncharacterized Zn finger protein